MSDTLPPAVKAEFERVAAEIAEVKFEVDKKNDDIKAAIERAAEKLDRHSMIQSLYDYSRCRQNGGSIEECIGLVGPRLIPPPPINPQFLEELLNNIGVPERSKLLTAIKYQLLEAAERIDMRLQDIDRPNQ